MRIQELKISHKMQQWRLSTEEMRRPNTEKSAHEICYGHYYVL